MMKSLKDARRRMTQTIVEKVGNVDVTADDEFDHSTALFKDMLKDLNECGATLHAMLNDQKKGYSDAQMLANSLARVYEKNADITDWPGVTNEMQGMTAAVQHKDKWTAIFDVIRSSCFMVNTEFALDPLKAAVTKMGPEVEAVVRQRNIDVKDYDSFTRRLKGLEQKKEQLDSQGKGNTPAYVENEADIEKFKMKVTNGKEQYEQSNAKAKQEIIAARKAHDQIMDILLTTTVVCQHQMFLQSAAQLEEIMATLPAARVAAAKKSINQYVAEGGIQMVQDEKSALAKAADIATGKAVPSDFKKSDEQKAKEAEKTAAAEARAAATVASSGGGNPFGDMPPPVPTAPPAGGKLMVTALFDHEVDEDDELPFSVGDKVEVVEQGDGGWWKGKCHGKEGLFPTNYVKID